MTTVSDCQMCEYHDANISEADASGVDELISQARQRRDDHVTRDHGIDNIVDADYGEE